MTADTLTEIAVPPTQVFFAEPGAVIMPLEPAQICPTLPALSFRAIAAIPEGPRHYLVFDVDRPGLPLITAHLGPDEETIARHGLILIAGLRAHGDISPDLVDGAAILTWLADCWLVTLDQIAAAAGGVI